jgi:hypothetical protein
MKKIIITLILGLAVSNAIAQDKIMVTSEVQEPDWSKLLSKLDTLKITSGVLYDKVTPFSNLIMFNTSENNVSSNEHFTQALSEMHLASNKMLFKSVEKLRERIATTPEGSVDIGLINTSFQILNFDEKDPKNGGLTIVDSTYKPINDKPSFIDRNVVVASPLKELVAGEKIVFNFNEDLLFTNVASQIKSMTVNFENSENSLKVIENSQIITNNVTVQYTTSGMKTLKFSIIFEDNSTITTYGRIYVTVTNSQNTSTDLCYELLRAKGTFTSTIPFQGYTETSPVYGKIEYTIFYHNNNGNTLRSMVKPIIIIDGFDPRDKRKVQDCDCQQDVTCRLENSDKIFNGINSNPMFSTVFNPTKHISIEDFMYYDDGTIDPNTGLPGVANVMSDLRQKGYDVIIINNPNYNYNGRTIDGGADYIERNAMNLVSFIKNYIKPQQAIAGSSESLVLITPSMAGQISRYALAYMEKKFVETGLPEWRHNARLWVSVDSPHLGANIPVGGQANIWFLGNKLGNVDANDKFNNELNSTAGKQQIISSFKNALDTGSSNANGGYLNNSPFFTTYYSNLNSNGVVGSGGYPVTNNTFRKIAMINGSLNGTKDANEGEEFLYLRAYFDLSFLFFDWSITLMRLKDSFTPTYGQSGTVFQGDGMNFEIGISDWIINRKKYKVNVKNNDIRGSLDVIPGGYFKTAKILKESIQQGISDAGARSQVGAYIENHSFIPSFSALGHLNPNQNWGNPLDYNLVCPTNKQIPFDSFYGIAENTQHTSFTKESTDWLYKELDGQPQLPNYPLGDNLLSGPDSICLNSNTIYTFNNPCKFPSVVANWSVSPNLDIISQSDYSITVKANENGEATITSTFQNGMSTVKTIYAGGPTLNEFTFGNTNATQSLCIAPGGNFSFSIPQLNSTDVVIANFSGQTYTESIVNTNWQWQTSNSIISLTGTKNQRNICTLESGLTSISVRAKNTCGWSEWYELPFEITALPQSYNRMYTVFPNPSNNIVNIDLADVSKSPSISDSISGELFDMMGLSKGSITIVNNKATFSVSGLHSGIYVVKIYINGIPESHQIAVP